MKSFSACIVVYKTHRLAFVLIGENIHTEILKTVFFLSYLYIKFGIAYHTNVHINTKVLCTVCLNPDPNKGAKYLG